MYRKKYTIEASSMTLKRFVDTVNVQHLARQSTFIEKVVSNSADEYYFVTVIADPQTHAALHDARFINSVTLHPKG